MKIKLEDFQEIYDEVEGTFRQLALNHGQSDIDTFVYRCTQLDLHPEKVLTAIKEYAIRSETSGKALRQSWNNAMRELEGMGRAFQLYVSEPMLGRSIAEDVDLKLLCQVRLL